MIDPCCQAIASSIDRKQLITHHHQPLFRKRGAVLPRPTGSADSTSDDSGRCFGSEELCGLQQCTECHQPHRVGVHDDRWTVLC